MTRVLYDQTNYPIGIQETPKKFTESPLMVLVWIVVSIVLVVTQMWPFALFAYGWQLARKAAQNRADLVERF